MYLGTCPSPLTIYNKIHSLQAGHYLEFKDEVINIEPYWKLAYKPLFNSTKINEFHDNMYKLCSLYSTGEVKKAIMLSGGLDSGALAYFFGKIDKNLIALNIYKKNSINDERKIAKENGKNANLKLESFEIPDILTEEHIKEYILSEEEPNSGPEPALFISKIAKEKNIKILYNALGPDEIFGGYEYFKNSWKMNKMKFFLNIPLLFFPKKIKIKVAEIKKFGIESSGFIYRQLFSWEEILDYLKLHTQETPIHPIQYIKNQITQLYPAFEKIPLLKKISYYDIFYYISSHHTFRSDQPSMKYSVEMRFPFLDHTFVEKYFNQENTFKNIRLNLKPKFRKYINNILPKKVLKMKKKGFHIPINKNIFDENKDLNKKWYMRGLDLIKSCENPKVEKKK